MQPKGVLQPLPSHQTIPVQRQLRAAQAGSLIRSRPTPSPSYLRTAATIAPSSLPSNAPQAHPPIASSSFHLLPLASLAGSIYSRARRR